MSIRLHFSIKTYHEALLDWYRQHGRHDLPWQYPFDPYSVWLSEIMLQQTQVKTVIPYYEKFVQQFPDVHSLANANVDQVMTYWAGLGYYARARNLHHCAKTIVERYNGIFPSDVEDLESLKGIGRSTAHAIASIAFGQPYPIMDGNVKRVFARLFLLEDVHSAQAQPLLWDYAYSLMPKDHTQAYTQAQMDLGATICTQSKPKCDICPLSELCLAFQHQKVDLYPRKKVKVAKKKMHTVFYCYSDGEYTLLCKRPPTGIWSGLYVMPQDNPLQLDSDLIVMNQKHIFTHIELSYDIALIQVDSLLDLDIDGERVRISELSNYALPSIFQKLFTTVDFISELKLRSYNTKN